MELSPSWLPREPNNLSAFYGIQRFVTVFTRACQLSLSRVRRIQPRPSHLVSLKSIPILSSHLRLALPTGLFLQPFPPKLWVHLPSKCPALSPSHSPLSCRSISWGHRSSWLLHSENLTYTVNETWNLTSRIFFGILFTNFLNICSSLKTTTKL